MNALRVIGGAVLQRPSDSRDIAVGSTDHPALARLTVACQPDARWRQTT